MSYISKEELLSRLQYSLQSAVNEAEIMGLQDPDIRVDLPASITMRGHGNEFVGSVKIVKSPKLGAMDLVITIALRGKVV